MFRTAITWVLAVAVLATGGCGGGSGGGGAGGPAAVAQLVPGSSGANAAATLPDEDGSSVASSDIVQHRLLSRLFVMLEVDATVAEVNAAATAVGATAIDSSRTGDVFLTLVVPRQASVAALDQLARTLDAQPGIAFASGASEFKVARLPEGTSAGGGSQFDHLTASRFPAAWNAQGRIHDCLSHITPVIVADSFGPASLRPGFFDQFTGRLFEADSVQAQLSSLDPQAGHGYDVALVLAGKFDAAAPIGAYPFVDCVEIRQLEIAGQDQSVVLRRLAEIADAISDPRFVINASFNFADPLCGVNGDEACTAETLAQLPPALGRGVIAERVVRAVQWHALATRGSVVDHALITVSAGNVDPASPGLLMLQEYPGFRDARWSSPFAVAANLATVEAELTSEVLWNSAADPAHPSFAFSASDARTFASNLGLGGTVSDLAAHTLLVGSATSDTDRASAEPSVFNFDNARFLAGGQGVVIDNGGDTVDGTSFAAPQVAGLIALLWAHSEELRNRPLIDTSFLVASSVTELAGLPTVFNSLIDAYGALLALDTDGSGTPIRLALLDSDDDGDFDETDVQFFSDAFGPAEAPGSGVSDFGRADLNGDGFSGGTQPDAFELSREGDREMLPGELGTQTRTIEGTEVHFDENAVTDLDVLCYYAYSDLYVGTEEFRRETLGVDRCLGVTVDVSFPTNVTPNSTTSLVVHVTQRESTTGQRVDAVGMHIRIAIVEGATATPAFGGTGLDGTFSSSVTAVSGADAVRFVVEVRRAEDAPVLVNKAVVAQVGVAYAGTIIQHHTHDYSCPDCRPTLFNVSAQHLVQDTTWNLRVIEVGNGIFGVTGDVTFNETYAFTQAGDDNQFHSGNCARTASGAVTESSIRFEPGNSAPSVNIGSAYLVVHVSGGWWTEGCGEDLLEELFFLPFDRTKGDSFVVSNGVLERLVWNQSSVQNINSPTSTATIVNTLSGTLVLTP
jgi:hypothetical protein